jgi:hypothetical protein
MTPLITNDECDDLLAERLNVSAWDNASDTDRTRAILQATNIIDQLNYIGEMTDSTQEHQFPRGGDSDIPEDIKKACAHITLALLDGIDPETELEALSMVSASYSNVRSTYDRSRPPSHILAGVPSVTAWRYILPFIRQPEAARISRV